MIPASKIAIKLKTVLLLELTQQGGLHFVKLFYVGTSQLKSYRRVGGVELLAEMKVAGTCKLS